MKFLLDYPGGGPEEVSQSFRSYWAYLESVRELLPKSAYEFATAPWHYDHSHHRCPHDSWLETMTVSEPASGDRRENRHVEILIRLLGAFHDGYLELLYPQVQAYSFAGGFGKTKGVAHGDWLMDEVRLSEKNLVHHEILFRTGSRWLIESSDIKLRWIPG